MNTILFNSIWVLPLLTVLACVLIPATYEKTLRTIHVTSATIVLAIVCYLTYAIYALSGTPTDPAAAPLALRFFTDIPWLSMFNAHYIVGADGLNMLLLALTAFIVWAGVSLH